MTTTILFWLAIPLGLTALAVGLLGYALLPFSVISLFNQFAAPRRVLITLLLLNWFTSMPPIFRLCGRAWRIFDPDEGDFKKACLLGAQIISSALTVGYLTSQGWIGTPQSTWLLTAYWFICLTQLWSGGFLLISCWTARRVR